MKLDPATKRPDPQPWQIAAIAFGLLGVVAALVIGAQTLTSTRTVIGKPGMFPYQRSITSVGAIVGEHVTSNLLGRDVILADVVVSEVLGERAFLLRHDGETVPVVLFGELTGRQPERAVTLEENQRIRIYGVIRRLRDVAEIANEELLDEREAAKLRDHEIYISALRVAPLPILQRERSPMAPSVPRVITSVAQFAAVADRDALQARDVVLDRVRVLRVLGDHVFVVGSEGTSVPVALFGELTGRQAETTTVIRADDIVRIYGVARRLRSVQEIEDPSMLSAAEAGALRAHDFYVSAWRVVQLERAP